MLERRIFWNFIDFFLFRHKLRSDISGCLTFYLNQQFTLLLLLLHICLSYSLEVLFDDDDAEFLIPSDHFVVFQRGNLFHLIMLKLEFTDLWSGRDRKIIKRPRLKFCAVFVSKGNEFNFLPTESFWKAFALMRLLGFSG